MVMITLYAKQEKRHRCIEPAQGWCTGKTQGDGMGREVGGGIRMGNTCKSMADSCQCMAKPITIKKKKASKMLLGSLLNDIQHVGEHPLPSKGCLFLCNNSDTSDISETTLLDLTKSVKFNSLWQYTLVILVFGAGSLFFEIRGCASVFSHPSLRILYDIEY